MPSESEDSAPASPEPEMLKSLYEGHRDDVRFLAERSFTSTIQACTLNVLVVGGLIAGKVNLLPAGKYLGTLLLLAFNLFVIFYLQQKRNERRYKSDEMKAIHDVMVYQCPSLKDSGFYKKPPFKVHRPRRFWDGSTIFMTAVLLTAFCSITALWLPLATAPVTPPIVSTS